MFRPIVQSGGVKFRTVWPNQRVGFVINAHLIEKCHVSQRSEQVTSQYGPEVNDLFGIIGKRYSWCEWRDDFAVSDSVNLRLCHPIILPHDIRLSMTPHRPHRRSTVFQCHWAARCVDRSTGGGVEAQAQVDLAHVGTVTAPRQEHSVAHADGVFLQQAFHRDGIELPLFEMDTGLLAIAGSVVE